MMIQSRDLHSIGFDMLKAGLPPAFVERVLAVADENEACADLVYLWDEHRDDNTRSVILRKLRERIERSRA
jgi:hypothetical protein